MSTPTFKTFSQLVSSLLSSIADKSKGLITNFNVGSIIRTITEVFAEVINELYVFSSYVLDQGFLDKAQGYWLDRKAREFGVTRHPAITTQGSVIFKRNVARTTSITIPARSIVATRKTSAGVDYRFFTLAEAVLLPGQTQVAVPVIAEAFGRAYNVDVGSIIELRTFIQGIDAVTNETTWITTAGADEESDADLRRRCMLAWENLVQGGTAAAYQSWALSVPGVKSVFIDSSQPRGAGTVDVYVMDQSGPPGPQSPILASVQTVINAKRPIAVDALVRSPEIVTIAPSFKITPRRGYDTVVIEEALRSRLRIMFNQEDDTESLGITTVGVGVDIVVALLIHLAMGIPGVYSVEVSELTATRSGEPDIVTVPGRDASIDINEYPRLGLVTCIFTQPTNE